MSERRPHLENFIIKLQACLIFLLLAEFHEGDHHESGGSSEFLANLLKSPPSGEPESRPKFVPSSRTLGLSRNRVSDEEQDRAQLELSLKADTRETQILNDKTSPNYLTQYDKDAITAWIAGKKFYLTTGGKRRIIVFITTEVLGDLMDLWGKTREEIASYSDQDLMARLEMHWRSTDAKYTAFYVDIAAS